LLHHVFTDSSKSSDAVGAAFVIPHLSLSYKFKLHHYASIFTAEATAIVEAILFLLRTKVQEAVIHSDSRSVLMAIHGIPNKSSSNWHITVIKSLIRSANRFSFSYHLSWVKSNANISGNGMAD
jgi:ribonuclease HI